MARHFMRFLIGAAVTLSFGASAALNDMPSAEWYAYNPPESEVAFAQRTEEGGIFTILIGEEKKERCPTVTFRAQFDGRWFERQHENGEKIGEARKEISSLGVNFVISRMIGSLPEAWKAIVLFSLTKKERWECGMKFDPTI
ncbi:MAG: hypothetical protein HYY60_00015 [Parcubacteria group bacterium]|nr:hypothetical protein [Parcubacteria group bacterium]MBI3074916.1 hypothetical protein [Parcubacteria group bacterium]